MVRLLKKAQATIEANTDFVEHKSAKYANRSLMASIGTFVAGSTVTGAGAGVSAIPVAVRALDIISTFITATGLASIYNASRLDQTKRLKTKPYNNLYTNLGVVVNHINSDKARIKMPYQICEAYETLNKDTNEIADTKGQEQTKGAVAVKKKAENTHVSKLDEKRHSGARTHTSKKRTGSFSDYVKEQIQAADKGNQATIA